MDAIYIERLGLIKPVKPVSFGLLTRGGRLSLMLPGWYGEVKIEQSEEVCAAEHSLKLLIPENTMGIASDVARKVSKSIVTSNCYQYRWQLSSALTTLHLVGLVSVANTLMSMNQVSFIPEEKRLALLTNASRNLLPSSPASVYNEGDEKQEKSVAESPDTSQLAMNHRAHIKAGWSQLAALHCCLLADLLKTPTYKPPLLHILARRWQDRCLEVRGG